MKAILEFNLPEERDALTFAIKGGSYYSALWDIFQALFEKSGGNFTIDEFNDILDRKSINLEEVG